MVNVIRGARWLPRHVARAAQEEIVRDIRDVVRRAPMARPETRFGRKMSVLMTSAGRLGWVSDQRGYRYEAAQTGGARWPEIPATLLGVWESVTGLARMPDCCLINYYSENTKMGLHQDRDEGNFVWPVVSLSLGDDALFRIGGQERGGKTESIWLGSGDVVVLAGESRLAYHGIDRIRFGSSTLLPKGGRLNVTMRVVDSV